MDAQTEQEAGTQPGSAAVPAVPAVDETTRLQIVRAELGRLAPWGPVTAEALGTLETHFRTRLAAVVAARAAVPTGAGAGPAEAPPAPRRPPAPSLTEFLADRSILIVSYVGAFLLIVATLLFELYGAGTLGGPARFAAVLALDLVFGVAGWWCLRQPQLRLVGRTYVAIFALLAPLVFVAAYTFLVLERYGIPVALAQAVAGGSCALLYGLLAVHLGSSGYAALSLAALPVGWAGAATLLVPLGWRAAAMTPLVAGYSALAFRPARWGAPFVRPAGYLVHAVAAVALAWLVVIDLRLASAGRVVAQTWGVPAALAGLALGYGGYCWLGRRLGALWTVAVASTLTALTASAQLEAGWLTAQTTVALELMALAWVYALAAGRLPAWGDRFGLHVVAGLQALVCVALSAQAEWLQAALLLAGAALGVVLATQTPTGAAPWWLLLTGVSLTAGWYWLARLAAPALLTTDRGRALAFVALPAALAVGGAVAGRLARRSWALPLYATAAVVGLWVTGVALSTGDTALLAGVLLPYAALVYALSAYERSAPGVVAAAGLLFGGVVSFLQAAGAAVAAYPPALAALAWAVYGAGSAWGRRQEPAAPWTTCHRYAALVAAGLVALACLAVPEFARPGAPGALAATRGPVVGRADAVRRRPAPRPPPARLRRRLRRRPGELLARLVLRRDQPAGVRRPPRPVSGGERPAAGPRSAPSRLPPRGASDHGERPCAARRHQRHPVAERSGGRGVYRAADAGRRRVPAGRHRSAEPDAGARRRPGRGGRRAAGHLPGAAAGAAVRRLRRRGPRAPGRGGAPRGAPGAGDRGPLGRRRVGDLAVAGGARPPASAPAAGGRPLSGRWGCGAGDGTRTRDHLLGRQALYQLSYPRGRSEYTAPRGAAFPGLALLLFPTGAASGPPARAVTSGSG